MKYSPVLILVLLIISCSKSSKTSEINKNQGQWVNPIDKMEFAWVTAGSITVQMPQQFKDSTYYVTRDYKIDAGFWMGISEVTVSQFRNFVKKTGYITTAEKAGNKYNWKNPGFKQDEKHPVVYMSYEDAKAYTSWANVDLPTEIQWLLACQGGVKTKYYWGDTLDSRYLWYRENSADGTKPVAGRLPNLFGLYDMVGNAWEYVAICNEYYGIRGASWTRCDRYLTRLGSMAEDLVAGSVEPKLARCEPYNGYQWDDDRGFRCVKKK